jgi:urease accessory protein
LNVVLRPRHRKWRLAGLALVAIAWVAAAGPVAAHENEVIKYGSFLGGLTHPVLGPDHLLAMLSVGILSTQIGGRAILTVPATFVMFMAVGGAVGIINGGIPMEIIEFGIAASVLVLGGVIAAGRRVPVAIAMGAVAIFGSMHGYAHGVETPTIADPAVYALGFLLGTASIHLLGVLIGEVARQYRSGPRVLRVCGAAIATMGGLFLIGVL